MANLIMEETFDRNKRTIMFDELYSDYDSDNDCDNFDDCSVDDYGFDNGEYELFNPEEEEQEYLST